MSISLDRSAEPLVRPRYTDAELSDPLPLWDRFEEACLEVAEPPVFLVSGPRGSGVTTALSYLAGRCREAGRTVVELPTEGALRPEPPPQAVLFADLSVTPLAGERQHWFRQQPVPSSWSRVPFVVGVSHPHATPAPATLRSLERFAFDQERPRPTLPVALAPWNQDDLIELLGAEDYREQRATTLCALASLEGLSDALRRPWTARLLVEAVRQLDPNDPPSLAKVYANVLDRLCPTTLDVLRDLSGAELTRRDFARFPLELPLGAAEELSLLLQTPREVAEHMIREDAPTPAEFEPSLGTLALPGLASFVQAGECVRWLTQAEEPPPVRPDWVPFFPELVGPELLGRFAAWFSDPNPPVRADGALATILHACGRTLQFGARRLLVHGAILNDLDAPGADLSGANFESATLARANLPGADLRGSSWLHCNLTQLRGSRLVLDGSWWRGCELTAAELVGSQAHGLRCEGCDLPGVSLRESELREARFEDCDLRRADFRAAQLRSCVFSRTRLGGAVFEDASLTQGRFEYLQLSEVDFSGARFVRTLFVRCQLAKARLELRSAKDTGWSVCDLSEADFSRLELTGARFDRCLAHGTDFSGSDLQNAVFEDVRFQLGSTREGMLLGEPASEGTRSGFYAEGTTDEAWATQPDLPLASFRGADLRGATFNCPVFRLDFRGATLDPELRARAKREGALLDT